MYPLGRHQKVLMALSHALSLQLVKGLVEAGWEDCAC